MGSAGSNPARSSVHVDGDTICTNIAGVAERLGSGFPTRPRGFDSLRPLYGHAWKDERRP